MQPVPVLSQEEIEEGFQKAHQSQRKRHPKILHQPGDYHNRVFNFLLKDTYMQPHRHPSAEKIEKMSLVKGSFALLYFDNSGKIIQKHILETGKKNYVEVPAFTWHTYVMLTDEVLVYETMNGVYDPQTWKELASWAPMEKEVHSQYLKRIINEN